MLLIKNGTVRRKVLGKTEYEKMDIRIDGNRIQKIGKDLAPCQGEIVDAGNMLVIPGLINCHIHSHDNFNKAWLDNMPLEIWMAAVRPFFSGVRHTPEQVYCRTLLGALEMLCTGTTAVMDDVLLNEMMDRECLDMVVKAYDDIGMRAVVSPHTKNIAMEKTIPYAEEAFTGKMKKATGGPFPAEDELLAFFETSLRTYNRPERRVTLGLSNSAPQRCTVALMEGVKQLAAKYDVPVSCHVLETYVQKRTGELFYGKSLVKYLADLGLIDKNLVLIHCNWIDQEDLELIRKNHGKAVHNPVCNMKMGSGIAPVYDMLQAFPVGLGTDNISANDTASLFESMKTGALLSKLRTPEYNRWLSGADVVDMATEYGSYCLNQEKEIGTIEEGKKADLVLLNLQNEHYLAAADYDNALAYAENGVAVDKVFVDGKLVVDRGRLTTLNEESFFHSIAELRPMIMDEHRRALKECRSVAGIFETCYRRCNRTRL